MGSALNSIRSATRRYGATPRWSHIDLKRGLGNRALSLKPKPLRGLRPLGLRVRLRASPARGRPKSPTSPRGLSRGLGEQELPGLEGVGLTGIAPRYKSEFEKELDELALKLESLKRAVEKASMLFKSLGAPAPSPQAQLATATAVGGAERPGERARDVIEELEVALRDFESKRAKVKEILEKMVFKVEDTYMRRDEVERLIEEVKRKAFEEALDDKRVDMVGDIIRDAIARLIELFRPAVQAFFMPAPATPATPATPEASVEAPPAGSRERARAA